MEREKFIGEIAVSLAPHLHFGEEGGSFRVGFEEHGKA